MRASLLGKDNLEFANYLLKIGEGEEGEELDGETWIHPQCLHIGWF